jgi:hypothetical protein
MLTGIIFHGLLPFEIVKAQLCKRRFVQAALDFMLVQKLHTFKNGKLFLENFCDIRLVKFLVYPKIFQYF